MTIKIGLIPAIKENYKIDRILNYNVYKSDTWIKE